MIKYVVAAASVGGLTLLGGQMLRLLPKAALPGLTAQENALLQSDAELHGLLSRLHVYARFDAEAYAAVVDNTLALIVVQGQHRVNAGLPRKVAGYISRIIEHVRVLRTVTKRRMHENPAVMEEFDDVAGGIQTACTSMQHNITLNVQYLLSNK